MPLKSWLHLARVDENLARGESARTKSKRLPSSCANRVDGACRFGVEMVRTALNSHPARTDGPPPRRAG